MDIQEATQILGLKGEFTGKDIKQAYRALVKKYHPDVRGNSSIVQFIKIKEAYDLLSESLLYLVRPLVVTHDSILKVRKI